MTSHAVSMISQIPVHLFDVSADTVVYQPNYCDGCTMNTTENHHDVRVHCGKVNGIVDDENKLLALPQCDTKCKGFETFTMTGDMMIKTTPLPQKPRLIENNQLILKGCDDVDSENGKNIDDDLSDAVNLKAMNVETNSKFVVGNGEGGSHTCASTSAPVAYVEDFSDLLSSSTDIEERSSQSGCDKPTRELPVTSVGTFELDEALVTLDKLGSSLIGCKSNNTFNHLLSHTEGSGDEYQNHDVVQDIGCDALSTGDIPELMNTCINRQISVNTGYASCPLIRSSKSHENYLQAEVGFSILPVVMDNDSACSLDAITMQANSFHCFDKKINDFSHIHKHNSMEEQTLTTESMSSVKDREFIPGFVAIQEHRCGEQIYQISEQDMNDVLIDIKGPAMNVEHDQLSCHIHLGSDNLELTNYNDDYDAGYSVYHQPMKGADQPSAARLAKRLFYLEGFCKSDVSRHLSKKNDFSNLVAEEYLKYFDFSGDSLDASLRKFLYQFCLTGETQERERVLTHFSHYYMICNPGTFNSEDACHTLTCAIMLLNTDLHGINIGRKMSCADFIENLSDLNDGDDFQTHILKELYHSIKSEPMEWAQDDSAVEETNQSEESFKATPQSLASVADFAKGINPFLSIPDGSNSVEYKRGYVMRKCCMEAQRRKTPFGRRSWRMVFVVVKDMVLYHYKDEQHAKSGHPVKNPQDIVHIHHALATTATDYTKKQHVLRLYTSNMAEYLLQAGGAVELQEWIDTINIIAASLSAPPLPSAVGSQAKFQRPLMPSSHTSLSILDQLHRHEHHVLELEHQLQLHLVAAPEKGSKSAVISLYIEKENFIQFELKRFKTYILLLQAKVMSPAELEPSLAETVIGEDEETLSQHTSPVPTGQQLVSDGMTIDHVTVGQPVSRSLSDRHSEQIIHLNLKTEVTWV